MAVYDINGNDISGGGGSGSSPFYDVKAYGAKGNGTADDTSAIQSALTACKNAGGGTVFFPTGTYKVTGSLICYSNQIIDMNGSTILQGGEISNLMMGYAVSTMTEYNGVHDVVIQNGTFDGGSYTTNNTLLGFDHAKNITIRNCSFVNAYGAWHDLEVCACYNVLIEGCVFEGARKNDTKGEMLQIDAHDSTGTWPWSNSGAVDGTVSKYVEVRGCLFYDGVYAPAIGNHTSDTTKVDESIRIHNCTFLNISGTMSAISLQTAKNIDIYNNTFDTCTQGVRQCQYSTAPTTVHDNRFLNVATPYPTYSSAYIEAYNNMIDGVFTE